MKRMFFNSIKIIFISLLISNMLIKFESKKHKFKKRQRYSKKMNLLQTKETITKKIQMENKGKLNSKIKLKNKNENKFTNKKDSIFNNLDTRLQNDPYEQSVYDPIDLEIGNGPVYVSGWIKYFKYYPTMQLSRYPYNKIPRKFNTNEFYREQMKEFPNYDYAELSFDGLNNLQVYIPGQNYFYMKLMKNSLLIITSRNVKNKKKFF